LDSNFIGKNIGQMKLEADLNEACFISPKVYGYITTTGKEVLKIKGFNTKTISYNDLKSLLIKDTALEIQTEMFKNNALNIKLISIKKKLTSTIINKRLPIYQNNILVNTLPLTIGVDVNLLSNSTSNILFLPLPRSII
jgi:hypothetical protein